MKKIINLHLVLVIMILLFIGCEKDYPDSLWDPDEPSGATPEIQEIVPPDSTFSGVGQIIINGSNFSSVPEYNLVYVKKLNSRTV